MGLWRHGGVAAARDGRCGRLPRRRPGTRETDLLDPANSVRFVDALLLAGGSAYGLAAADGVMRWLEEHRRGVAMDSGVVPIVPGAVIFDLPVGGWNCRPTADFGYSAVRQPESTSRSGRWAWGLGRAPERSRAVSGLHRLPCSPV